MLEMRELQEGDPDIRIVLQVKEAKYNARSGGAEGTKFGNPQLWEQLMLSVMSQIGK